MRIGRLEHISFSLSHSQVGLDRRASRGGRPGGPPLPSIGSTDATNLIEDALGGTTYRLQLPGIFSKPWKRKRSRHAMASKPWNFSGGFFQCSETPRGFAPPLNQKYSGGGEASAPSRRQMQNFCGVDSCLCTRADKSVCPEWH